MSKQEPKFIIGTKYKTRNKAPRLCTVVDIYKTYNADGELVRVRYVSTHAFCGQTVTDYDVPEIAIERGKSNV